jgi:hypothetical protein
VAAETESFRASLMSALMTALMVILGTRLARGRRRIGRIGREGRDGAGGGDAGGEQHGRCGKACEFHVCHPFLFGDAIVGFLRVKRCYHHVKRGKENPAAVAAAGALR